ncbi:unnamed protein product [Fusarium graminearum]|uniref:Uncharacterized protein n=1 Tax=Gibberella zeae TaxID=5518 RepID=A0A4E9EGG0_GIBZA|nr:unnamed protein product [Fusarium graminearum]CAG1986733.1 unnamed protein product [Fusarium graminearum]
MPGPISQFNFPLHPSPWFACAVLISGVCVDRFAFPLFFCLFLIAAFTLLVIKSSDGIPFSCFPYESKCEGRQSQQLSCNSFYGRASRKEGLTSDLRIMLGAP